MLPGMERTGTGEQDDVKNESWIQIFGTTLIPILLPPYFCHVLEWFHRYAPTAKLEWLSSFDSCPHLNTGRSLAFVCFSNPG